MYETNLSRNTIHRRVIFIFLILISQTSMKWRNPMRDPSWHT